MRIWRMAAIFAVLVIVALALPKTVRAGATRAVPRRSILALLRSQEGSAPLRLATSFGILILLGLGVSVVMPPYLSHHYRITLSAASGIMAVINVVMILGSALSGLILTRGVRPANLFIALAVVGSIAGFGVFAPWTQITFTLKGTADLVGLYRRGDGRAGIAAATRGRSRAPRLHRGPAQPDRRAHHLRHLAVMAGGHGAQSMAGAVYDHPRRLGHQHGAAAAHASPAPR